MRFFVLTFSNGVVVSDYFGNVCEAEAFAVGYCGENCCSLIEMLGMQSIAEYLREENI